MDVRCERCSTEYEFDDALVSGRGTTVKCTNCGHKFKIRRSQGDPSEDYWNVTTQDGRTLVFTSLRELQRAIQTHLVERTDMISRGGLPSKAIGQIPELVPFFDVRDPAPAKSVPPRAPASATLRSSRPPPPPGAVGPALSAPPRTRQSTRPDFPPPPAAPLPSMTKTLSGTGPDEAPPFTATPPMRARMSSVPPPPSVRDETANGGPPQQPPAVPAAPPPPAHAEEPREPSLPRIEASSPVPPPTPHVIRTMGLDYEDHDSGRPPSVSLPDAPLSMGRRRSVGGFVVVAVLLLGVIVVGAVWARDHLGAALGPSKPAPAAKVADPRVTDLVTTGERALADGNLDVARESFDKASVLADKDPRVLLGAARLSAMRADVPWLKQRLLSPSAVDEQRLAADALAELAPKARKAADDALAVAPDDASALRAKIDALRLAGDRDGARALVSKITAAGPSPESAYVLAALDLAEPQPLWSTVIERLRTAASAETGPGRARAALVYALERSGDLPAAKAELDRLEAMPRRHELFPLLRASLERSHGAGGGADAGAHPPDAGAAVAATTGKKPEREPGGGGAAAAALPSDPRVLVAHGEAARAKGDLDRAHTLFAAALDKNPADTEAISGLAAVAYARRDLAGARASYKRVLSMNPSYVPALVGVADCDWESGDRSSAMKIYKEIVDRFPEGTYPARVKQRVEAQ